MTDLGAEAAFDVEMLHSIELPQWITETQGRKNPSPGPACVFNLGSVPEKKEMTDLGAEAALDAEHGDPYVTLLPWSKEIQGRKSPPLGPACVFNLGSLPETKKMTDLGAEAALDAEHGDPYVKLLPWSKEIQGRKSPPSGPACVFNLGSLPETKKMTDLGAEAALDAEHGDPYVKLLSWSKEIQGRKSPPSGPACIFTLGSLPETKKMTDLGAEAALDAEHGDPYVKLLPWSKEIQGRKSPPSGPACVFNLGSLPETNKETKTPVKKREYKPRYSSEMEALNQNLKTKIRVEAAGKKMDRSETDKSILLKHLTVMMKKLIKIDKSVEERVEASKEIEKIKMNIIGTIELLISNKNAKDHAIEIWKNIKKINYTEFHEIEKMNSVIAAKRSELAEITKQNENNFKVIKRTEPEGVADFSRKIQKIEDFEVVEKMKIEEDHDRRLKTSHLENEESQKKIRNLKLTLTEIKKEIKAKIKHLKKEQAQQEFNMKIPEIMRNKYFKSKEEHDKKLQIIQNIKAEKQIQIETEIKIWKEKEKQASIDLEEKIKVWQNSLVIYEDQVKNNIKTMHHREAEKRKEIEAKIKNMKEFEALTKTKIAKKLETLQNKLAEEQAKHEECIKEMEKFRNEKEKQIKAKIKSMEKEKAQLKTEIFDDIERLQKAYENNRDDFEKNIAALGETIAKKKGEIEKVAEKMKDIEHKKKKAMNDTIEAMKNKLFDIKKEIEENLKLMQQNEANKKSEIEAEIRNMKNIEARKKEIIDNNIESLKNTLTTYTLEFEKSIRQMEQNEAEKISEMKDKIQRIKRNDEQKKYSISKNISELENTLAITKAVKKEY